MLATALLLFLTASEDPCTGRDELGRRFATCFDPWRGVELFAGGRVRADSVDFTLSTALRLRKDRESVSKTDSVWLGVQRLAAIEWAPRTGRLDATAWDVVYRRHASETGITLPGFPDARLPFPFDVGVSGHLAHFEFNARPRERWSVETLAASLLFDPVRASSGQVHFGVGPTTSHRLIVDEAGAVVHQLSPFTRGEVFLSLETSDGRLFLRAGAMGGALLQLEGTRPSWLPQVQGSAELGWVPLALNDQPIVLALRGDAEWRGGAAPMTRWSAAIVGGFRFGSRRSG